MASTVMRLCPFHPLGACTLHACWAGLCNLPQSSVGLGLGSRALSGQGAPRESVSSRGLGEPKNPGCFTWLGGKGVWRVHVCAVFCVCLCGMCTCAVCVLVWHELCVWRVHVCAECGMCTCAMYVAMCCVYVCGGAHLWVLTGLSPGWGLFHADAWFLASLLLTLSGGGFSRRCVWCFGRDPGGGGQPPLPSDRLLPFCPCSPATPPRGRGWLCAVWGRVGQGHQSTLG